MSYLKGSIQPPRRRSFAIQSHGGYPVKWVRQAGLTLAISIASLAALPGWAEEPMPSSNIAAKTAVKARWFGAKVLKRSTSKRVLLLELSQAPDLPASDPALPPSPEQRPGLGRIVLFKIAGNPVLGVRVIKIYPEAGRFAVRRVQLYGNKETLDVGDVVTALEKVGEVPLPESAPSVIASDNADLKELEAIPVPTAPALLPPAPAPNIAAAQPPQAPAQLEVPPLDAGASPGEAAPAPVPAVEPIEELAPPEMEESTEPAKTGASNDDSNFESDEKGNEDDIEISVKEIPNFDPHRHSVTLGYGMVANGNTYWSSAGARYAMTMFRDVFAKSEHVQDALAFEGGLYLYRLDANSVVSTIGTARYNLWMSPNFSPFFYAGFLFNYATPGPSGTNEDADSVTGLGIAAGAGLMFQFAPQWILRFDLGMDMLGAGIMLRF